MTGRPTVVAFDVNETLSDMEPLRARFADIGAPEHLLEQWFAATLRDGFALTLAGGYAAFSDVAAASLRMALSGIDDLRRDLEDAVAFVLAGLPELDVHTDVPEGIRRLHDGGVRLVTLTNGSVAMSEAMLDRAGVLDHFERRMSVGEVRRWKPAAEPYLYAAAQCGVSLEQMALIAVHPWDTDGAKRAGLITGWVNRKGQPYPLCFREPDVTGSDLPTVADALLALGGGG
ncbi:MAG: haloacid dehalogenase type II [Actinobacteria bacterium]|nr:haloacid dehalogenase type II [Actinomycetota bacterium]